MKKLIDPINTSDGLFHGKNKETGELATIVTSSYMNDSQSAIRITQQELIAILTAAEIKPDEATSDQVLTALKKLFLDSDNERVSNALQKGNNLSDLSDGAKAKENLALDKVGNWVAVQQGGGTGMESNKVYVGWDGEKLIVQVDSTTMGDLFYGAHPPTAAQTGAYPQTGGNVGGHVNATYLSATQQPNPGAEVQGTFIGWNESGGQGESDFINNRGGGVGGFIFRIVNSDNSAETGRVTISGAGDLNTGGTLSEEGQRVYSPNNPQPQQDLSGYATRDWVYGSFVAGFQIGARVTVSGADSSVVPQGAVGIVSMTVNDDRVNQIVYAYPMYAINGNWVNAG